MGFQIEGLDKLAERLDTERLAQNVTASMEKSCLMLEREAKQNVPSGTGMLRNSIGSEVKKEADTVVGEVGTPLQYAVYVEYGTGLFAKDGNGRQDVPWHYKDAKGEWHSTSGQKPSLFLTSAMNKLRQQIVNLIGGNVI